MSFEAMGLTLNYVPFVCATAAVFGQSKTSAVLSSLVTYAGAKTAVRACILRHHCDTPASKIGHLETAGVDVTDAS